MRVLIPTKYRPVTVMIKIRAKKFCHVMISVTDSDLPNTYLTKRDVPFTEGMEETVQVMMPLTSKAVIVDITGHEGSFEVLSIEKKSLPRSIQVDDIQDGAVRSFVRFAQRFCFNAGWLPLNEEGKFYVSDDGKYKIKYVDTIIAQNADGSETEQITPASIIYTDGKDGKPVFEFIEVSKAQFKEMSFPIRFCLLCHEFAHLFMNEDMTDETEADLNGLSIYLSLNYPRIEAHETFASIFLHALSLPGSESEAYQAVIKSRYDRVTDFINKFQQINFLNNN